MEINWIGAIVVILNHSTFLKEVLSVKIETFAEASITLTRIRDCSDAPECNEVESRVKVINPPLRWTFTIRPRTIRRLTVDAKLCS